MYHVVLFQSLSPFSVQKSALSQCIRQLGLSAKPQLRLSANVSSITVHALSQCIRQLCLSAYVNSVSVQTSALSQCKTSALSQCKMSALSQCKYQLVEVRTSALSQCIRQQHKFVQQSLQLFAQTCCVCINCHHELQTIVT